MKADEALKILLHGNERFSGKRHTQIGKTFKKIQEVEREQHPFAVIVGCSDSRVPPEIIFDVRLGDLFTIRTAGHVVGDVALGSIGYAVNHLKVELVVVMGHMGCGAVTAALESGGELPQLSAVLEPIRNAIKNVDEHKNDYLDKAVRENILSVADGLRSANINENLKVVGALYDMHTGKVAIIS